MNLQGKATLSVSCQEALTRQALDGPVSFPPAFTVDGEAPPEQEEGGEGEGAEVRTSTCSTPGRGQTPSCQATPAAASPEDPEGMGRGVREQQVELEREERPSCRGSLSG